MAVIKIVPFPGPKGDPGPGNFDGGRAGSVYTTDQNINGGDATGHSDLGTVGG
jgi:hypothetical protein